MIILGDIPLKSQLLFDGVDYLLDNSHFMNYSETLLIKVGDSDLSSLNESSKNIVKNEIKRLIFPEKIFENESFSNLLKVFWTKTIRNSGANPLTVEKLFLNSLNLRESFSRTIETVQKVNSKIPEEILVRICLELDSTLTTEEFIFLFDELVEYPEYISLSAADELISHFGKIEQLLGNWKIKSKEEWKYFFVAFRKFLEYIESNPDSDFSNLDFHFGDSQIFEKLKTIDGTLSNQKIEFFKNTHPWVQIGLYLKAMEDGIDHLEFRTFSEIYGVDFNHARV